MARRVIFLTTTGQNTWTVPNDWNNVGNEVYCLGSGGVGGNSSGDTGGGGGGGGAAAETAGLVRAPGTGES